MKKLLHKSIHFVSALLVTVVAISFPSVALASDVLPQVSDMPAWVYSLLGVAAGVIGVISQIDAQISEEFKRKWPWWLRLAWNLLAGNYRHSENKPH